MDGGLQQEMNFSARSNRFREHLDHGDFVLLIESAPPDRVIDPASGAAQMAELENAVLGVSGVNASLAILDRGGAAGSWRSVEYAAKLPEANRDRHVVYLSGANTSEDEMLDLLKVAGNAGCVNVVPVTGSVPAGIPLRECRRRRFAESIQMTAAASGMGLFAGAAVNPFQYNAFSLFGQYFSLARKFRSGAGFVVTQAGWDMLKLQSLNWYLMGRELCYPMIARLMLLTPDQVERISAGKVPGVFISEDFKRILSKELLYSRTQFEAAQYRRLELQAAGCRLFGFSGVQLSGVEYPAQARIAAERIANAITEYNSFEQWLEEYNSYLASVEMAPFSDDFCLYDRVLQRPYPADGGVETGDVGPSETSWMERCRYHLRKFLFSGADSQRAGNSRLLKVLLNHCRGCSACHLAANQFICPHTCPKGLINGPCGGVRPDGRCEIGDFECIHSQIARIAHWRGALPELEKNLFRQ